MSTDTFTWFVGSMLLAAAAGCAGPAVARNPGRVVARQAPAPEPPTLRASRHFRLGVEAYQRGDLAAAREHFEQANAIRSAPDVLFNLARVYDAMDERAQAAQFYLAYLRAAPDISPEDRRAIDRALARINRRVGWLIVDGNSAVAVDGAAVTPTAPGTPIAIAPGVHSVDVGAQAPLRVRVPRRRAVTVRFRPPENRPVVSRRVGALQQYLRALHGSTAPAASAPVARAARPARRRSEH